MTVPARIVCDKAAAVDEDCRRAPWEFGSGSSAAAEFARTAVMRPASGGRGFFAGDRLDGLSASVCTRLSGFAFTLAFKLSLALFFLLFLLFQLFLSLLVLIVWFCQWVTVFVSVDLEPSL
jgi:hypothetical protein